MLHCIALRCLSRHYGIMAIHSSTLPFTAGSSRLFFDFWGVYIHTYIYAHIYICILFCTKICMREIDVLRAARSNNAVSSASCIVNCGSWHLHAGTRYTTSSEALKAKVGLSILCTRTWDYTAFHSSTIWLVCGKTLT